MKSIINQISKIDNDGNLIEGTILVLYIFHKKKHQLGQILKNLHFFYQTYDKKVWMNYSSPCPKNMT